MQRKLTIRREEFVPDWEILSKAISKCPASGRSFISNVARSARLENPEDEILSKAHLLDQLCKLKDLEGLWLSVELARCEIENILICCPKIAVGDFSVDNGVLNGNRDQLVAYLKFESDEPTSPSSEETSDESSDDSTDDSSETSSESSSDGDSDESDSGILASME